jgi:hypothetical protein
MVQPESCAHAESEPGTVSSFVLANGSMSSNQSGEGEIRMSLMEADIVDGKRSLPSSKNEIAAQCGASQ